MVQGSIIPLYVQYIAGQHNPVDAPAGGADAADGAGQHNPPLCILQGSIIRSMRLLEELMRQMVQASKNIGNTELENKFAEAIKLLKRDIVFAASLYL